MTLAIKILRDRLPTMLSESISEQLYTERRKPFRGKFFNNAHGKIGLHDFRNRLCFIGKIDLDWHGLGLSNDAIRTGLKKALNFDFI